MTPYNSDQLRDGKFFNTEANPNWHEITLAEQERAAAEVEALIEATRQDLTED